MATVTEREDLNPEAEAEALKNALDGCGTNEAEIIRILSSMVNKQRQEVASFYTQAYGSDVVDDLMGDLAGDFQDLVVALMTPMPIYAAKELREAMKGAGTDEVVLIEILCSKTNEELEIIKEAYQAEYDKDLTDSVRSETRGDFKNFLTSVLNASRDESVIPDLDMAKEDAMAIYEAGAAQWGTDESEFNKILCTRSWNQLKATFEIYERETGKAIEEVLREETSGELQKGFLAIVTYARSPSLFFSTRIHSAVKGLGTDEHCLIRCISYRCEYDMEKIKRHYQEDYDEKLADAIWSDVRGNFKKLLLALIGDDYTAY